uniref:AD domain-containing protein n=1 Tax=Clastoptera arizonana TaxID=38151 RepID=A0A1B6D1D7_9HEMI
MEIDIISREVNPIQLRSYINKEIKLTLINGKEYVGVLFTIDPITKCVVLILQENKKEYPVFVPKDSIKKVVLTGAADVVKKTQIEELLKPTELSEEELLKNRESILRLLSSYLPNEPIIEEENKIIVVRNPHLKIIPPYGLEDISTDNPIILERFKRFLSQENVKK